jgi:hypothetical protein
MPSCKHTFFAFPCTAVLLAFPSVLLARGIRDVPQQGVVKHRNDVEFKGAHQHATGGAL